MYWGRADISHGKNWKAKDFLVALWLFSFLPDMVAGTVDPWYVVPKSFIGHDLLSRSLCHLKGKPVWFSNFQSV